MPTAALERLPKTVSACRAEIARLQHEAEGLVSESERITELENERDELKDQLKEAEAENEKLEARVEELEEAENPDAVDAINKFLDQVERPVGQYKFDVIHGPAADRAIVGLFEAAGRQP